MGEVLLVKLLLTNHAVPYKKDAVIVSIEQSHNINSVRLFVII
jgi:hypothetical protein